MHLYMFLLPSLLFQYLCVHMFMGLVARMVNDLVASSSPVGGSGMLTLEGTDFLVLGVCGCPRIQASFGVGVLGSVMSSPA